MALISFCGLLTLQVGAAILAAVFFTIVGVVLAANIFDYYSDIEGGWFPYSLVLMLVFVILMAVAGVLMFASSYTESRSFAIMALVAIIIIICYWLILCFFSFLSNPDHVKGVCIQIRCPESFWLANLRYRKYHRQDDEDEKDKDENKDKDEGKDKDKPENDSKDGKNDNEKKKERGLRKRQLNPSEAVYGRLINNVTINELTEGKHYFNNSFVYNHSILNYYRHPNFQHLANTTEDEDKEKEKEKKDKDKDDKEKEGESPYYFGNAMIGAIILFIINLVFLIFAALVMYSWATELDWADYYIEDDDPVIIVEDY